MQGEGSSGGFLSLENTRNAYTACIYFKVIPSMASILAMIPQP